MRILLFLFCLIFTTNCKTKKDAPDNEYSECKTFATVKDFTGMDGCQFLIILENGDKLLPAKLNDENFEFKDGQKIRFDYKEIKDFMSICMVEEMAIKITCIKELE
jgi:hypothetical protein